jgi:hypothetical protein
MEIHPIFIDEILNINTAILLKLTYQFNATHITIPSTVSPGRVKLILKTQVEMKATMNSQNSINKDLQFLISKLATMF